MKCNWMLGIKSGNGVNFRFPSPYPRLCREGLKRKEMRSKRNKDSYARKIFVHLMLCRLKCFVRTIFLSMTRELSKKLKKGCTDSGVISMGGVD